MEEKLKKLETSARQRNIPIMLPDGIAYLCNYIKENNVKSILEIGSAVGYSAIKMALVSPDIKITTIEKDKERYQEALENIKSFNLLNRITIINDDAINTNITDTFDLIFIDASKGHNIDFFQQIF